MGAFDNYKTSVQPYQAPQQSAPRPSGGGGFNLNPFLKFGAGILHGATSFLANPKTYQNIENSFVNTLTHHPENVVKGYMATLDPATLLTSTKTGRDLIASALQETPRSIRQVDMLSKGQDSYTPSGPIQKAVYGSGTIHKPKDAAGYAGTALGLIPPVTPGAIIKGFGKQATEKVAAEVAPKVGQAVEDVVKGAKNPLDAVKSRLTAPAPTEYGQGRDAIRTLTGMGRSNKEVVNSAVEHVTQLLPSKTDRIAVSRFIQGADNAAELSPQAKKVAEQIKSLMPEALQIRKAAKPTMGEQGSDYLPRLLLKNENKNTGLFGGMKNLRTSDKNNLGRQVDKFVDPEGKAHIGTQKSLNLRLGSDGSYFDQTGKQWFRQTARTDEIHNANLGLHYEEDVSKVLPQYLENTLKIKDTHNFIRSLQDSPQYADKVIKFGDEAPKNFKTVHIPGLEGYRIHPALAEHLDQFVNGSNSSKYGAAYDKYVAEPLRQTIFYNALVHPLNMTIQALAGSGRSLGPAGMGKLLYKLPSAAKSVLAKDAKFMRLQDSGLGLGEMSGRGESFTEKVAGKIFRNSDVAKTIGRAIDKGNPLHWIYAGNKHIVGFSDDVLRLALHDTIKTGKMSDLEASRIANKFMVDYGNTSRFEKNVVGRFLIFYPWLKGTTGAFAEMGAHPVKNVGTIANLALLYAMHSELQHAWQEYTGNKDAKVRQPGMLKTGEDIAGLVPDLMKGKVPAMLGNHIAPVPREILQQVANKQNVQDLFTRGKSISGENSNNPGKSDLAARIGHAVGSTVAPLSPVNSLTSGKKTPTELGLNQLGLTTPHTKGQQAAPNLSKGPLAGVNVAGAKPGTGIPEAKSYNENLNKMLDSVQGDKAATAAVKSYMAHSYTPDGKPMQLDQQESRQRASALFTNDKARGAMQQFQRSQKQHDPMWDLPPDRLKTFMNYESMIKSSPDQLALKDANSDWISQLEADRGNFFNSLPKIDQTKNPRYVKYPLSSDESNMMGLAASITDPQAKARFYQNHPELSQIEQKYGDYVNQVRKLQGANPLPSYPRADQRTQGFMDKYFAASKDARKSLRTSDPNGYAGMQAYLADSSLNSLLRQASIAYAKGGGDAAKNDQKLLKAIASLGNYDITQDKNGNYHFDTTSSSTGGGRASSASLNYWKTKSHIQTQKAINSYFRRRTTQIVKAGIVRSKSPSPLHVHGKKEYAPKHVKVGKLRLR